MVLSSATFHQVINSNVAGGDAAIRMETKCLERDYIRLLFYSARDLDLSSILLRLYMKSSFGLVLRPFVRAAKLQRL